MIRSIGKVFGLILLAINILIAVMFIFCAYSPYINPVDYPVISCLGLAFPIFLFLVFSFLVFWLIVYKRYSLVSFAALFICLKSVLIYIPLNIFRDSVPNDAIKVLSYNSMAFDNDAKDENGKNPILEYIKNSDADIVCLQEFIPGGKLDLNNIMRQLSCYKYSNYYKLHGAINGVGIFSRFPILSVKPIVYDSSCNGSVAYELKVGNDTVVVINNHLESNKLTQDDKNVYSEMIKDPNKGNVKYGSRLLIGKLGQASKIRSSQADSVAKYISANMNKNIVVCGDFNDSPISYAHHKISGNLKDAFADSGIGTGISYNQNHFYFRIDHILVSDNISTYKCTVDKSINNSDHYPIWCYIKFNHSDK